MTHDPITPGCRPENWPNWFRELTGHPPKSPTPVPGESRPPHSCPCAACSDYRAQAVSTLLDTTQQRDEAQKAHRLAVKALQEERDYYAKTLHSLHSALNRLHQKLHEAEARASFAHTIDSEDLLNHLEDAWTKWLSDVCSKRRSTNG